MIYLSKKDILDRIKAQNLEVILEGDDSILDPQELDAIHEVASYLSHEYDVKEIFKPVGTSNYVFDYTIKRMVIDIMLYNLHNSRVNPRNIPENIVQKRDDAISWLKDVANPKVRTEAPFLPKKEFEEKRNNVFAWGSNAKKQHRY